MILFQTTHNKLYAFVYILRIYTIVFIKFQNKVVVVKPFVVFNILYTFIQQLLLQYFMNFMILFHKDHKLFDLLLLKHYEVEHKLLKLEVI